MGRRSTFASAAKGRKGPADKAAQESAATAAKKKWRVPQEMIDFILAWDASDYVPSAPDNLDDMPIPEESKKEYREERKHAVALMQERRRAKREMHEWVRAELAKNGGSYIEVETTAEMLEKHQLGEYIPGQTS